MGRCVASSSTPSVRIWSVDQSIVASVSARAVPGSMGGSMAATGQALVLAEILHPFAVGTDQAVEIEAACRSRMSWIVPPSSSKRGVAQSSCGVSMPCYPFWMSPPASTWVLAGEVDTAPGPGEGVSVRRRLTLAGNRFTASTVAMATTRIAVSAAMPACFAGNPLTRHLHQPPISPQSSRSAA